MSIEFYDKSTSENIQKLLLEVKEKLHSKKNLTINSTSINRIHEKDSLYGRSDYRTIWTVDVENGKFVLKYGFEQNYCTKEEFDLKCINELVNKLNSLPVSDWDLDEKIAFSLMAFCCIFTPILMIICVLNRKG